MSPCVYFCELLCRSHCVIKMKIERRPRVSKGSMNEESVQPTLVQVEQTTGLLTVVDLAGF